MEQSQNEVKVSSSTAAKAGLFGALGVMSAPFIIGIVLMILVLGSCVFCCGSSTLLGAVVPSVSPTPIP